jgi:uncharacterized protein
MATDRMHGMESHRRRPAALPSDRTPIDRTFYCHGFGSHFDPAKDKVAILASLAPVHGITVDYTRPPAEVFAHYAAFLQDGRATLIVGTSMGGFFAAWLGSELGLPFLAINPAIAPALSLRKHVGHGTTHFGTPFYLGREVVEAYEELPFRLDGHGEIALDLADEVIDAKATIAFVNETLPVRTFDGGSHRFDHMRDLLPHIRTRLFPTC